jgi:peroxiredoxin (alkyl hydroperoxide reductase subunit C)
MAVLVGKPAPDFNVAAVLGTGEIVDSYQFSEASKGKYALVFFYHPS